MDTSHPTEIALSRTKTLWLVLGGLAFVGLGVWLILSAPEIAAKLPRIGRVGALGPAFVRVVGVASVAFFGFVTAFAARRLAAPTPGLVLDAQGLTDRTSAVAAGVIPWADIAGIETGGLMGQQFVYVLLRDPEAFLQSVSPVKRAVMRQNQRLGPSPVALTSVSLDASFDEMAALVRAYWRAHGPSRPAHA